MELAINAAMGRSQMSIGRLAFHARRDTLVEKELASNAVLGRCQVKTCRFVCHVRKEHTGQMAKLAKHARLASSPTWEGQDALIVALDCTLKTA